MASIQTNRDLHSAIVLLEQRQQSEKVTLEQHYRETYERLQPVNILKNIITEVSDADDLRKEMLFASISLALGFIAKKLFETYAGKSKSPVTNALGMLIQFMVSGWLTRNRALVEKTILYFFTRILRHKQQKLITASEN